ncbi:MAG: hypothetical protein A2351_03975 [Omnitrophica bacterium RIFOXYB12_FULL_50_7]|nr:MAG: hypothetical protein A2351_03975 [Omnitrophica bacterium RIFOXYB12_FULL_50_7]
MDPCLSGRHALAAVPIPLNFNEVEIGAVKTTFLLLKETWNVGFVEKDATARRGISGLSQYLSSRRHEGGMGLSKLSFWKRNEKLGLSQYQSISTQLKLGLSKLSFWKRNEKLGLKFL